VVSPFSTTGFDQELVRPGLARVSARALRPDRRPLILTTVRCGSGLHLGSSWEPVGPVLPDLSGVEQCDRHGHPLCLGARVGPVPRRGRRVFVTARSVLGRGQRRLPLRSSRLRPTHRVWTWMAKAPAGRCLEQSRGPRHRGQLHRPPSMPYFFSASPVAGDSDFALAGSSRWPPRRNGAYLHCRHNWFISASMTHADLDRASSMRPPASVRRPCTHSKTCLFRTAVQSQEGSAY